MDVDLTRLDLTRLDEFPQSREAWEEAAARALGSRTLDQLRAVTADGVRVPALGGPRPDCAPMPGRGAGRPWSIVQKVVATDPGRANRAVLDELAGGADAIDLVLAADGHDGSVVRVFADVHLDMAAVHLTGAADPWRLRAELAAAGGRPPETLRLHAGFDPFAGPLRTGGRPGIAGIDAAGLRTALAHQAGGTVLSSRGEVWHALGAGEAQQLALALATGRQALGALIDGGGDDAEAARLAGMIEFRLVADPDQFVTTAKFRAFRRLWALVLDGFGLPQVPAFVHAEASWRTMTRRDPWTNILRSTIAAFAAAVGGADAITTVPHTALIGAPDAGARRLSRNVQVILAAETNLHRVGDPAAGAGGQEDLADALAEAAWEEFRRIEAEGGLVAGLASGAVLGRIAEADAAARGKVAARRMPITGTSTYPLLDEREAAVEAGPPLPPPAAGARRLAEPFEALRDRADAAAAAGARPAVFLAALGPVAAHTTRATWARNLLAAGGIASVGGEPILDAASAADAFRAAGTSVALVVSDDATYAVLAAAAVRALKDAGAAHVAIAGRRREGEGGFDPGPADGFVHEGLDMVAFLTDLHERLGTPAAASA